MAETPRYALVTYEQSKWPEYILLCDVDEEVRYHGAVVICREDEDCMPSYVEVEPAQPNPRRAQDDDGA